MKNKANLLDLTDESFTHLVLASTQPALVEFGTSWSGPCQS
jgi:thioredoxin-like negative regulator of GroEL